MRSNNLLLAGQLALDFADEATKELLIEPEFQFGTLQRCQNVYPVPFLHGRLQSIFHRHTTLFRQPLQFKDVHKFKTRFKPGIRTQIRIQNSNGH